MFLIFSSQVYHVIICNDKLNPNGSFIVKYNHTKECAMYVSEIISGNKNKCSFRT